MKPKKLIEPDLSKINKNEWYLKYKHLNSALFTINNSARVKGEPNYYYLKNGDLKAIKYINANNYKVVGYTLNPPVMRDYECVAIMFENQESFEKIWFHYNKYE